MKHLSRAVALLLALALTLTPALASQALGWELHQTETTLGPGFTVTTRTLWGDSKGDYRTERYATYTPGQGVTPVVAYGGTVPTRNTLTALAKSLESAGGRLLAGANGDYFTLASGVPLGLVVTDGLLRSSSAYHFGVGFQADGTAFVGRPGLEVWADMGGYHLSVYGGYNKDRPADGSYTLYNSDFGASTRASGQGVSVVLRPVAVPEDYQVPTLEPVPDPETGEPVPPTQEELDAALLASTQGFETLAAQLTIGGSVTCVVEGVSQDAGAVSIPAGRFVLTMGDTEEGFLKDTLLALRPGEQVALSVTAADPRWTQAVTALGAFAWILQDGAVPSGLEQTANPRTALGVKPDGQVVLYTVDGRAPGYSVGASVTQVARRLLELGCTDAVLFDGGGSTTFGTTGALDQTFSVDNRPSDGGQRAVANALFFRSELTPTGTLGSVYIDPQSDLLLSGARTALSARGIDTGYYPLGEEPLGQVTYTVDGPGRVEGNVFVAGGDKGVATVTARTPDGAEGKALMTVIPTPDTITVLNEATGRAITSLNLEPGERASLTAEARWYKLRLGDADDCYTWACDPALGTIDAAGTFTAGSRGAAGSITVSAGGRTASIPVTVAGHVNLLEDFEGEDLDLSSAPGARITTQGVARGRRALAVTPGAEGAFLPLQYPVAQGESFLGCWLYGNGTSTLRATLRLADGSEAAVDLAGQPFTGWQRLLVPIPENAQALVGLALSPGEGELCLDQLVTANQAIYDCEPPTARVTVQGSAIAATLSDNADRTFAQGRVAVTVDGAPVAFTLSGRKVTASCDRLADGGLHRVSVTLSDAWGNLGRGSAQTAPAPGADHPFGDTQGHWAEDYIDYMCAQGVTNGRVENGQAIFDPGAYITRGEFATMLARWLGRDLPDAGAALPFVDGGDIPDWARPGVAALYEAGVFAGSQEADGLYAKANDTLTRAQAMTMLGRVQPRGYAPQTEPFSDHGEVPAWAVDHVYSLAGQGVVSGYQGAVRPQEPITRAEVAKLLATLW